MSCLLSGLNSPQNGHSDFLKREQNQTLASSSKSASLRAEFALESVPLNTDSVSVSKLVVENTKRDGCSKAAKRSARRVVSSTFETA